MKVGLGFVWCHVRESEWSLLSIWEKRKINKENNTEKRTGGVGEGGGKEKKMISNSMNKNKIIHKTKKENCSNKERKWNIRALQENDLCTKET